MRAARLFILLVSPLLVTPVGAQSFRDANCDAVVDDADRDAVAARLFTTPVASCASADVNRDGGLTAADLVAMVLGPRITAVGLASPDGRVAPALGTLEDGATVFFRNAGFGFLLVVEAAPSASGAAVGTTIFDSVAGDPRRRPDLQVLVDRRLGDGSRTVCDEFGVPGIDPPDFAYTQAVSDTINDLACRFTVATTRNSTCTQDEFGQPSFIAAASRAQFCLPVTSAMGFAADDTRLTVQMRDETGLVGPSRQLVLRVGSGPMPPTFTPLPPTPTRTATPTPSATETASATATASFTRTPTRTATATASHTATRTPPFTPTPPPTPTRTRTGTATATGTRTATGQATATRTRTPVPSATRTQGTAPPTATATRTATRATPTRTRTATAAGTPTRTGTRTRTVPFTPTVGPSATRTRTRTISPTPTATSGSTGGPEITFFGLARADDMLQAPTGNADGVPIYEPLFGSGFSLIVEAKPGSSRAQVSNSTFAFGGPPDLRIQVTRPLGDGSSDVCDDMPPILGGVPAIDPPDFSDDPSVDDRLNDLACRFIDGLGNKIGRNCGEDTACVLGVDGEFGCVAPDTTRQFCGFISQTLQFPPGDTLVTVRVVDVRGNLGPPARIIVRIQ